MSLLKENWVVYKMIRSHLDDVYDLAWSPCSQFLLSGSVDNSAIITNVHKNQKVAHFSDSQVCQDHFFRKSNISN